MTPEAELPELKESVELVRKNGVLLVITGLSGAGKDTVLNMALDHESLEAHSFSRIVTCATREPRPGEVHGVHYHFITEEEIFRMHRDKELVEKPVLYGNSYKATPLSELQRVIDYGENVIWRVEPDLAGKIAEGTFFDDFGQKGHLLKEKCVVIFVDCDEETINERRKNRDEHKYDINKYAKRDEHDRIALETYRQHFKHIVENPDGENDAVERVVEILTGLLN